MRGVCSECGLGFEWGEVLNPARSVPGWLIEHPRGVTVDRIMQTYLRAFWPWRCWRSIRLEHEVRLGVLAWFAALTLAVTHLGTGLVAAGVYYVTTLGFVRSGFSMSTAIDSLRYLLWPYDSDGLGLVLTMLTIAVMIPAVFVAFRAPLAKAKVHSIHLVRGFVLTLPIVATGSMVSQCLLRTSMVGWVPWPMAFIAVLATGIIHTAAWWVIVRQYLRLARPLAVTIAATGAAWLAGMVLFFAAGLAG